MTLPYDYYPAVLYAIERIAQGCTPTRAIDESNISIDIFERYVNESTELQSMLHEADRRSHDAMADALVNIDNHKIHGQSDPKMAKVISDNIKWVLERRASKKYGAKVEVNHNITADKAITDALLAGRRRAELADQTSSAITDAVFEEIIPEQEELAALLAY